MYRRLSSSSTSSISLLLLLLPLCTVQSTDSYRTQLFPQLASIQQSDPAETMETGDPEALTIPSKCQRDYLEAMMHRCRHGDRVCFADGQLAAIQLSIANRIIFLSQTWNWRMSGSSPSTYRKCAVFSIASPKHWSGFVAGVSRGNVERLGENTIEHHQVPLIPGKMLGRAGIESHD